MTNKTLIVILGTLMIYFGLTTFGGQYGRTIMSPLILFVTFLHEFGHAFAALLTGGSVRELVINSNGSGYTNTAGGSKAIILMGGYIASAIFGNALFYIGAKKPKIAPYTLLLVVVLMIVISLVWSNSLFTKFFLIVFGLVLLGLGRFTNLYDAIIMFLGLVSILYIIQDFNVGPTSDLNAYADLFVFIPSTVWMYVWLIIVVALFVWNIRFIMKKSSRQ